MENSVVHQGIRLHSCVLERGYPEERCHILRDIRHAIVYFNYSQVHYFTGMRLPLYRSRQTTQRKSQNSRMLNDNANDARGTSNLPL